MKQCLDCTCQLKKKITHRTTTAAAIPNACFKLKRSLKKKKKYLGPLNKYSNTKLCKSEILRMTV